MRTRLNRECYGCNNLKAAVGKASNDEGEHELQAHSCFSENVATNRGERRVSQVVDVEVGEKQAMSNTDDVVEFSEAPSCKK